MRRDYKAVKYTIDFDGIGKKRMDQYSVIRSFLIPPKTSVEP